MIATIATRSLSCGLLAAAFVVGCSRESRSTRPAEAADAVGLPNATDQVGSIITKQFERFLSTAIATRAQRLKMFDSVYTVSGESPNDTVYDPCPEDFSDVRWLADYRVIAVNQKGDTAVVTAAITTVARQIADTVEGRYRVTPEIREDTAQWRMVRVSGPAGLWKICGDASEHFGVIMAGRQLLWPRGASAATLRATIDSLRQARGLRIIR